MVFLLHKSHHMSNSKSCVSIDVQFIFVQVFVCPMWKTCKNFAKHTHCGGQLGRHAWAAVKLLCGGFLPPKLGQDMIKIMFVYRSSWGVWVSWKLHGVLLPLWWLLKISVGVISSLLVWFKWFGNAKFRGGGFICYAIMCASVWARANKL